MEGDQLQQLKPQPIESHEDLIFLPIFDSSEKIAIISRVDCLQRAMEASDEPEEVIESYELDHVVDRFKVSQLEQIGTMKWFEKTVTISKLYKVAVTESLLEQPPVERVKEALTAHSKVDHMVFELLTVFMWKENVLTRLVKIEPAPMVSFPTYMVLYYEVMLHGIVQAMIFHGDTFNYLRESCEDLVEYCVIRIRQLVCPLKNISKKSKDDPLDEIESQNRHINFNIGSQCVATLRYICENLDSMTLSVSSRIYATHDVPVLITQLFHQNIWTKKEGAKTYKFNETEWKEVCEDDPPLTKMECQVWLLLRQMLLHAANNSSYHYSDYRREQLTQLLKYMNDRVLDQLSVLVDLQRLLYLLQMRAPADGDKSVHNPLIVEVTPLFLEKLSRQYEDKWDKLAVDSSAILFYPEKDQIVALAKAFSGSIENLMNMSEGLHRCTCCMKRAANRCSQCKKTWYCSRSCQVQHWTVHKTSCSPA